MEGRDSFIWSYNPHILNLDTFLYKLYLNFNWISAWEAWQVCKLGTILILQTYHTQIDVMRLNEMFDDLPTMSSEVSLLSLLLNL